MSLQPASSSTPARRMFRDGKVAFALAVFAVVLLACLPQTGWLVRAQLRSSGANGDLLHQVQYPNPLSAGESARVRGIADTQPDNFALHLAAALRQEEGPRPEAGPENNQAHRAAERVWQLRSQFPNEPALYATYLRLNCIHGNIGRPLEQELLTAATLEEAQEKIDKGLHGKPATPGYWESHPQWLATMIEAARKGEELEPKNAYFPVMRSLCHFAQKQDTEALAAIDRAGAADHWNPYCLPENEGRLALSTAEYGRTGLIAQIAIVASQLLPELAQVRSMARIATALAVRREQQGDVEGGLHIRRSVSRIGSLMRRDGGSIIGSFVGSGVVQVAASRPGGAPPIPEDRSDDAVAKRRQAAYQEYLTRIGHAEDAQQFSAEVERGETVQTISKRGLNRGVMSGSGLVWVGVWWSACFALLVAAFWMLVGGGIGAIVARGTRVRDSAPLHFAARRAIGFALAAPVVGFLSALPFTGAGGANVVLPTAVAILLLCVPIVFLVRNPSGTGREMTRAQHRIEAKRCLKIYCKTVGLTLAVLALVSISCPFIFSGVTSATTVFQLNGYFGDEKDPSLRSAAQFLFAAGGLAISVPLATFVGSFIWSRKRKLPASVCFALGFRAAALPVAALLLLLYAGAVVQTSRIENTSSVELTRMCQHEGRYLASLVNIPWPEAVIEAAPVEKEEAQ